MLFKGIVSIDKIGLNVVPLESRTSARHKKMCIK